MIHPYAMKEEYLKYFRIAGPSGGDSKRDDTTCVTSQREDARRLRAFAYATRTYAHVYMRVVRVYIGAREEEPPRD